MELGKVLEVKLTSSTQTTLLIDTLKPTRDRESGVDTLILKDIYSIWKGPPQGYLPGDIGYGVSLLLQYRFYMDSVETPITFTTLKKDGINKVVHVDEKKRHFLLGPIIEKIKAMEDMEREQEIIIPFDKPIALNAQSYYMHRGEWGRTQRYYFVGMKVWRFH